MAWDYTQLEQWTQGLTWTEAERELLRQGVPTPVRQQFLSYRQRWGMAPAGDQPPTPSQPRMPAHAMGMGETGAMSVTGPSSPQWIESFYAEAMRYGVTRPQVESMVQSGRVTQATQIQVLQEIQRRVAPGYPEYVGAMQEAGARQAEIASPMRYAQWPAGLRARWGVMRSGPITPMHEETLPRTEYGEQIVPESHIMWKGRKYLYPTQALEATFLGRGGGRLTATYAPEDLGKRVQITGVQERVSMAGLPEFRGAMRPGPEAISEDIYTKIRAAAVIGGAPGPPGMGYIQRGLGPITKEATREIKIQPGQEVTPYRVGEWQPRGSYRLIEGGQPQHSPWFSTRITGAMPIQEERLGEMVTTGYRFHLQQAAQFGGGPLAAAVKSGLAKYIYAPEELESRITTPGGQPLGVQMLTEIKDPGGYAYNRFIQQYSQATPELQERAAARLGFTRGAEPSYGELAPAVMQQFAERAEEMVQTVHWQQRPFHVSQREVYSPVIVPGTEQLAPKMGPGMRTATMEYQAMVGDIGVQFMAEYGAGTPFINAEMLEEMRRGGPEAQGLARRFEQEGARVRNAYRALYRAHMASTGEIAPEQYRTLQDPQLREAIFAAAVTAEAGGPADVGTQAYRFFGALRTRRGAMPIQLGPGTFMPAPRFLRRFSGPGVMEEEETSKLQIAAFKALTRGAVSTESPEYEAALGQYREIQAQIAGGKKFPQRLEGVFADPRRAFGGVGYSSPALRPMEAYVPQKEMQGQVGYIWAHPMQWGAETWDPRMQQYFMTRQEAKAKGLDPGLFHISEHALQAMGRDVDADLLYAATMGAARKQGAGVLSTTGELIRPGLMKQRAAAAVRAGAGELLTERVGWKGGAGGVAPTREEAAAMIRQAWEGRQEFTTQEAWRATEKIRGLYEAIGPRYQTMRNALAMAQSPEQVESVEAFHRLSHGVSQRPAMLEDVLRRVHTLRTFTEKGGIFDRFGGGPGSVGMPMTGFYALRGAGIEAILDLAKAGKLTPEQAAPWLAPAGREYELANVIAGAPREAHRYAVEMWGGPGQEGMQAFMTGSLIGRTLGPEVAERFVYETKLTEEGKRTRRPRSKQEWEAVMRSQGMDPQSAREMLRLREFQRAYGEVVGKQRPGGGRTPSTYAVSRTIAAQTGLFAGSASWLGEVGVPADLSEMAFARAAETVSAGEAAPVAGPVRLGGAAAMPSAASAQQPAWLSAAMAGDLGAIPISAGTATGEASMQASRMLGAHWGRIDAGATIGGLGSEAFGGGGGAGPPPPPLFQAAATPGGRGGGGGGRVPPAGPAWATGAWTKMSDIQALHYATSELGEWGDQLAGLVTSGGQLNKAQEKLFKQYEGWGKTLDRVSHETERMAQRIKEFPGADPEWQGTIGRRLALANAAMENLSLTPGYQNMAIAANMRAAREQAMLKEEAFGGGGAGGGGGIGGRIRGFLGDVFGTGEDGRGGRGMFSSMALGWTAFKLRQVGWYTYGMPMRWEQEAMPYLQAGMGFGLAMGQPYGQVLQGNIAGQLGAQQAQWQTFQAGMGISAMQTRMGMMGMLGVEPTLQGGQQFGRVATPLLYGLGGGLSAAIGAGFLGAGPVGSALAAGLFGTVIGGTALAGGLKQAAEPSALVRERAEILEGLRTGYSVEAQAGMGITAYEQVSGLAGQAVDVLGRFGVQVPGWLKPAIPKIAGGAAAMGTAFTGPDVLAARQLVGQEQAIEIQRASIRVEQLAPGLGLDAGQALDVASMLPLAGYGFRDIMGGTQAEFERGAAGQLLRRLAPLGRLGMVESATSALTQIAGALGVAPGMGMQPYMGLLGQLTTGAGAVQLSMAAQVAGGAAGAVGAVAQPWELQQVSQWLAQGMPERQAQMIMASRYGAGPISQAMGVPAGFGRTVDRQLIDPLLHGQLRPEDVQRAATMIAYGRDEIGYSMMIDSWGGGAAMLQLREQRKLPTPSPDAGAFYAYGPQGIGGGLYGAQELDQRRMREQRFQLQYGPRLGWGQWATQQVTPWNANISQLISTLTPQQQEQYAPQIQAAQAQGLGAIDIPMQFGGQEILMGIPGDIQQAQNALQRFRQAQPYQWSLFNLQAQSQRSGIAYQMAMASLQHRQALESLGLQQQMWGARSAFQRQEMGFTWEQMQQGQAWGREDFAFNRQVSGLQYGWQMEDLGRGIRLATGREKAQLIRERGRAEEMYTIQEGRRGTMEERQEKLWQQEEDRFARQRDYFEQINALEKEQFEMRRRHINETYALQMQYLADQQGQIERSIELQRELKKIAEAAEEERLVRAVAEAERAKELTEAAAALDRAEEALAQTREDNMAHFREFLVDELGAGGAVWKEMQAAADEFERRTRPTKRGGIAGRGKSPAPAAAAAAAAEEELLAGAKVLEDKVFNVEQKLASAEDLAVLDEQMRKFASEERQATIDHLGEVQAWREEFFVKQLPRDFELINTRTADVTNAINDYLNLQVDSFSESGRVYRTFERMTDDIIDWIEEIRRKVGGTGGEQQHGGPVRGGQSYIVGEAGPELFVPGEYGYVVPSHRLSVGGLSISSMTINVPAGDYGSPNAVAQAISRATRRELENMLNDLAMSQRIRGGVWQ